MRTWLEISSSAFAHNYRTLLSMLGPVGLGVVIKSEAYGHGLSLITKEAEKLSGITWLCTAGIEEAVTARLAGSTKNILVMAYHDRLFDDAIMHGIDLTIDNLDDAAAIHTCAKKYNKAVRVHLKVDTGLARLGCLPDDAIRIARTLKERYPLLDLYGLYTHLADTNNPDVSFTHGQLRIFNSVHEKLAQERITIPYAHALSSGALILGKKALKKQPDGHHDRGHVQDNASHFARVGTNMYGLWKSSVQRQRFYDLDPSLTLKPVLQWKTNVVQINQMQPGESVGYNRLFCAQQPSRIAILPVGYADGYPRILSQRSIATFGAVCAPVVGVVSMNFIAADVTNIPGVSIGSEACLVGDQRGILAHEVAHAAETINNELLTRISPSIPRIIVA